VHPWQAHLNNVNAVKEFLEQRGCSLTMVAETFTATGKDHNKLHWCRLVYSSFETNTMGNTKKEAKQNAYADLWAHLSPPLQGTTTATQDRQKRAWRGDKILAMIVSEHVAAQADEQTTMFTMNHTFVNRTTNAFLLNRYAHLGATNSLPAGLPPPSGLAQNDPTNFEAWVADIHDANGGHFATTSTLVLQALGLA